MVPDYKHTVIRRLENLGHMNWPGMVEKVVNLGFAISTYLEKPQVWRSW